MSLLQYSEEQRQRILSCYGKTQKIIDEDIENIQNWMKKQPHLPEIADRRIIERILMTRKYRVEKTKEVLDNYYTLRSLLPEFYEKNVNDNEIKKIMDAVYFITLPKLTEDLNRVTILRTGANLEDFNVFAYITLTFNVAEVRFREDYCLSDVQIYDLEGVKAEHLLKFTPTITKRCFIVMEKVFSVRAHGIHFLNASSYVGPFLNFLKSFLKPKLAERIHIHRDMESLYRTVPKSVLPKDYGGEEKSLAELNDLWKDKFLEYRDLFENIRKVRVNEDLRPGKPLDPEFYGIDGNFRKLEVD
ncbi:hypothetical protein ILUMI_26616 [Ignelater luminosus]|uniref:CRAL-TRIO domain-containing protein n=1 Tax=Ignelater luminosus TaxID=2038154 RepID=A0A8K0FVW2_IGNLU|nr:hypothetical protein ILUMI_26616 [Ignelater luminosus]